MWHFAEPARGTTRKAPRPTCSVFFTYYYDGAGKVPQGYVDVLHVLGFWMESLAQDGFAVEDPDLRCYFETYLGTATAMDEGGQRHLEFHPSHLREEWVKRGREARERRAAEARVPNGIREQTWEVLRHLARMGGFTAR